MPDEKQNEKKLHKTSLNL